MPIKKPECDRLCCLLFCDPQSEHCVQTPEFKLALTQYDRKAKERETQLAEARARQKRIRHARKAARASAEVRTKVAALSYRKYDGRVRRHI